MEHPFAHAIIIMRMRPGPESQRTALHLLLQHGPPEGTQWILASASAQTLVALVCLEEWNAADIATLSPYFDMETIPVCSVDDEWFTAMRDAIGRQHRASREDEPRLSS